MTYLAFLIIFLIVPILLLGWLMRGHLRRQHISWIAVLMTVALVYTSPWDNYLVATRVWWYDPALVLGLTIGWVPIEEYAFFLLQPLMVGLWVLLLARTIPERPSPPKRNSLRIVVTLALGLLWLLSLSTLIAGPPSGTYLALIGVWALPPIALQSGFGADILWNERRRVLIGLLPAVVYLSLADSLAINSGTWTINPVKSLEIYLGNVLPLEEFVFFLMTNVLIVFSIVLLMSKQSFERIASWLNKRFASSFPVRSGWASHSSRR